MIFAFATLAFLVAAWLALVVLAGTLEYYGPKILAALAGKPLADPLPAVSVRLRQRYPTSRPLRLRARPQLRAAA